MTKKQADQKSSANADDLELLIAKLNQIDEVSKSLGAKSLAKPCSIHNENGSILWVNAQAAELLGLEATPSQREYLDRIQVQDRVVLAHYLAGMGTVDKTDSEPMNFRLINKQSGSKTEWLEISQDHVQGETTGEKFILSSYRDVSFERLDAETHDRQRIEAEKENDAKSQFLANISHELRTPLNAILGFSELLNSPLMKDISRSKQEEYVGLIHDSASHLLTLLNGILDMSKIENGMYEIFPENFSLSNCLQKTTAIMQGQASKNEITLHAKGLEDLPDIVADERALKQIMINLLSNAIKFSNEKGMVSVEAHRKARTISICVKDNGIGISPEHLQNLGKPFFQADSKYDRKYEGTGLGLSVVKGLVELHGGSVSFASKRGAGTEVTLVLPIFGKTGRRVPAKFNVEKITTLQPRKEAVDDQLRILRNTA
jgi:cell cycle sensor histidine kinase DivJ